MPIFQKDGKSILFIHIPKTGGSSIETAFRNSGYSGSYLDGKVGAGTLNNLRRCTPQHMHSVMLRQNFRLYRFDLIFMIVRNPVARFSSEYLWRHGNATQDVSAAAVEKWGLDSFREFQTDSYIFDNHLRPQADFLVEKTRVFRFENGLETAIAELNADYGLGLTTELPRVRDGKDVSGFSSRDVEISSELDAAIRNFYHRDYLQFTYGARRRSLKSYVQFGGPRTFASRALRKLGR